ncbi:hypothetical protein BN128_2435 [Cronobacter sakazakii 696]|nr:hypothetical protein BN128_2435 [Cronobacter sakazakii 696]
MCWTPPSAFWKAASDAPMRAQPQTRQRRYLLCQRVQLA